jgi:hypothetical protein
MHSSGRRSDPAASAARRTRTGAALVLTFVVLIAATGPRTGGWAAADEVAPRPAHDRPRLGWICSYWSQRVRGDFNGDGRMDRAVFYDLAGPSRRCFEERLPSAWRVTLFLGAAGRAALRLPTCDNSPSGCGIRSLDLNGDGRDELAVTMSGGLQGSDWTFYTFGPSRMSRIRYRGVPRPALDLQPGYAAVLGSWTGISYVRSWGCPRPASSVVAYVGHPSNDGRGWSIRRARLLLRGVDLTLMGFRATKPRSGVGSRLHGSSLPSPRLCR